MDEVEITAPEPEEREAVEQAAEPAEADLQQAPSTETGEPAPEVVEAAVEQALSPGTAPDDNAAPKPVEPGYTALKPVVEAIVYLAEEPVTIAQIAAVIEQPAEVAGRLLADLMAEYAAPSRGLMIREVAGGYKMGTKPEHHDVIRKFVKSLKPPLKLSLAALETLATIAYKQPITAPEIMAIRGVQGAGVLKTLLDRKLIVAAGRKNVVGRPVLYKTSKEFLVQFGLKDLSELPTLKEFEELRRLSSADEEPAPPAESATEKGADAFSAEAAPANDAPAVSAGQQADPAAGPEPETAADPQPEAAAGPEPEAIAEPEPEANAAPQPEPAPQPRPEAELAAGSDPKNA
jgi:segregation and condensation protein B